MYVLHTELLGSGVAAPVHSSKFAQVFVGDGYHEHLFRDRFYQTAAGNVTIAQFVSDFPGGKMQQITP